MSIFVNSFGSNLGFVTLLAEISAVIHIHYTATVVAPDIASGLCAPLECSADAPRTP